MKRRANTLLLAGLLTLSACSAPATPNPPAPTTPAVTVTPKRALGVYELSLSGDGKTARQASVRAQATEVGGLVFQSLKYGYTVDTANNATIAYATFQVTNNSGVSLAAPTLVPIDTAGPTGTAGYTAFRALRTFTGADASGRAPGLTYTAATDPDGHTTPLVTSLDSGSITGIDTAPNVLAGTSHSGWVMPALASGATGKVTLAIRIPGTDTTTNPFSFNMIFTVADSVPQNPTLKNIADVQGSTPSGDAASPLAGQSVTLEGVVTRTAPGLSGYFFQEEGMDADASSDTSDGIFVYCATTCPTLNTGDRIRVTGTVAEFRRNYKFSDGVTVTAPFTTTQLTGATTTVLSSGLAVPDPVTIQPDLPVSARERLEGMLVTTTGVVTNNFPLGRFGSVDLAAARIMNFTQVNAPSAAGYAAFTADFDNRFIRVDDASTTQNPATVFARDGQPLSASNTLRGGDTGTVTGVLHYDHDGFGDRSGSGFFYRVHAAQANFTATNPRPASPADVGGTLRVGSMNVLNYFTSLDGSNTGCTPNGTDPNARGANNCEEFGRQQAKTVEAILGVNADVLGLLEMQNDFAKGPNSSVANLVAALNARAGAGTYAYVNPGRNVGGDVISVAMIYKTASVDPVGNLAVLDNSVDATYTDSCNRPTWAQTFQSKANGGRFTAVMMHLKSKGSACAALGDADTGDGQGNAYQARANAATAIVNWLNTNPTGVTEDDRILMGDYNAYATETPLSILAAGGYANLFPSSAYSYQFDGQWGSLDHATASASLQTQVTGQTKWHINADEPIVLDYNTEFKNAAQRTSYYAPDAFRSSDHDPVIVGLNLTAQPPLVVTPPAPVVSIAMTPATAAATVTASADPAVNTATTTFTATGTNTSGPLNITLTPQGGAPAIVTAPATATSGAPFTVTVTAPAGTTPGTYTYAVKAENSGQTATSTLTVTVQPGTVTPPATGTGKLIISEFRFRGPAGANDEFIELYNAGTAPLNIGGYKIEGNTNNATTWSTRATVPAGVTLQPGQFYLLTNSAASGYSGTVTGNQTYGTGISDNRAVRVTDAAGTVLDLVGFAAAGANSPALCEATCIPNTATTNPAGQASFARNVVSGQIADTDDNATDFTFRATTANPQNSAVTFTGSN